MRRQFTILHSSEHHATVWPALGPDGRLVGGLERRATLARRERERGGAVLLLDSGDVLYGATASAAFGGRADMVGMGAAGYDAMGCGNHDFDLGPAYISQLAESAAFPILAANVLSASAEPVLPPAATLSTCAGSALIASVVSADVFSKFNPPIRPALKWLEPLAELRRAVGRRTAAGPDLVVVIAHQTTEDDCRLAAAFPDADIIVGGHVNGFGGLIPPGAARPVPHYEGVGPVVVKATRQGRHLGRLEVELLPRRRLRARAALVEVGSSLEPDPAVTAALRPYRDELDQPLGCFPYVDGNLMRTRRGQAEIGRLVVAAIRWRCRCDVALQMAGGVFSDHLCGVIRYHDVVNVLPYRSRLMQLRLTAAEIAACLEHGLRQVEGLGGVLLQTAGLRVVADPRRPAGQRVVAMEFEAPCGPDGRYAVAAQEFLARGGAGFPLNGAAAEMDLSALDCLREYLRSGPAAPAPPVAFAAEPAPAPWTAGEEASEFCDGDALM